MVLTPRPRLAPAIIVPDEQSWALLGSDPAALGLEPVFSAGAARRALLPARVPATLAQALTQLLGVLPSGVPRDVREMPLGEGVEWRTDAARGGGGDHHNHHGHDHHDPHGHDHGDHADMMAIVGEPSADGLVMETIKLRFGPLATPFPGGLLAEVELDGDVVRQANVRALLRSGAPAEHGLIESSTPAPPDLLAPVAWRQAIALAAGGGEPIAASWERLALLELERAVSHLVWLRSFGRILGWRPLIDACTDAVRRLPSTVRPELLNHSFAVTLKPNALDRVVALVGSPWLRWRAGDIAPLSADAVRELGLRGLAARASGVADDARAYDPLYRELGFEPLLGEEGDALGRARLRAREARSAIEIAQRALACAAEGRDPLRPRPAPSRSPGGPHVVEGPRGPLVAERAREGWGLAAPGSAAARAAAAQAMVGYEWSAALVALASFDLSPWEVGDE